MSSLEPEHVRRWLERMHPTDECGVTQSSAYCPLATYLHEASGGQEAEVGTWDYLLGGEPGALPPWARSFVARVDDYGEQASSPQGDGEVPIPAALALALLERAVAHPGDDPQEERLNSEDLDR